MLAQTYSPVVGGEERLVEDLSRELARRGHDIAVATLRQPLGEPPESADGVRVHLLDSAVHDLPGVSTLEDRRYAPPAPDPRIAAGLRGVLRAERPDIVHAHNWLVDSYLPLARRAEAPLVLSLHDYSMICATKRLFYRGAICSGPSPLKCLRHSIEFYGAPVGTMVAAGTRLSEPWLRRRVDMFLSVSSAVEELCGVDGEDTEHRVVPNLVGALPPPPAADDPALAALPDEPFVLFFGDVAVDKGARRLVETYATLEEPPPLVLIGRRVDEMPPVANVHALGPLPHAATIEALRRSLFSVAPSIWAEPFGIVALEAAAAGKPVVASEIGGLRDIVVDGETGLLVPPDDPEALRAALALMVGDAAMRARMGAAARERAACFSPDIVVPEFERAYRAAIRPGLSEWSELADSRPMRPGTKRT